MQMHNNFNSHTSALTLLIAELNAIVGSKRGHNVKKDAKEKPKQLQSQPTALSMYNLLWDKIEIGRYLSLLQSGRSDDDLRHGVM